jgi:hypothetical protein
LKAALARREGPRHLRSIRGLRTDELVEPFDVPVELAGREVLWPPDVSCARLRNVSACEATRGKRGVTDAESWRARRPVS